MFNKTTKKSLTLVIILTFVFLSTFTAYCASRPITFKLAHSLAPDHPFAKGAVRLAEIVKKESKGRLIINVYDSASLGSEKDIADNIVNGIVEMGFVGPGELGKRFKPIQIIEAPFVFRNMEHAQKVIKSSLGQNMFAQMAKQTGIRVLAAPYYGTRYVTTSKVAVKTPADMRGLKLRTPDMPLYVATIKALGANPTPMALSEVYLGLQQGVVDGQENPLPTIYSQKFNEVQKYLSLTGHVLSITPLVISDKKLKMLPQDLQKVLVKAVNKVAPSISNEVKSQERSLLKTFKTNGMKVIKPDIAAFRKATLPVIRQFEGQWGKGLYEQIQAVK
jgi:tripartite ATP-independent transporter DctP family solute receptor